MQIQRDAKDQPYVEWQQGPTGWKRAWIQEKEDPDKDWAGTRRYLNVVRVAGPGKGPAGNATDFPIWSDQPSEQILTAFVIAVCGITGCRLDGAQS